MIPAQNDNRLAKAIGLLVLAIFSSLYLASYFFLWKIKQSPYTATPFTLIQYWHYWGHLPDIKRWLIACLIGGALPSFGLAIFLLFPKKQALHGQTRFATNQEIKAAGLYTDKGIILGKKIQQFLILPGQTSVICAAPPRSGKGVGLVQPNMLNWSGSVVILDIRKESWRLTSGFRQKYTQVYLFDPLSLERLTCEWNPLFYISSDPLLRINDIQKIAAMLFPDPEDSDQRFWMSSSRTLFLGLALYVIETPGLPVTIGEMLRQIMFGEGETVGEHWKKIISDRANSDNPLSDTCIRSLYDFVYTSPNTQSNIRKSFTAELELWLNPLIDTATSGNSFDLRDLRRRPISLYIGVTPDNLGRLKPIINLLFQQILDLNTQVMPEEDKTLKHQLLLLMDEFTAIGRIPVLAKSISFIGGYNIRMLMIIQSPAQLRATYGNDTADTFMECMGAQVVFAPKSTKIATEISENIGYNTVETKSISRQLGLNRTGGSVNISDQRRALLLPQEVKDIGQKNELIFIENMKTILCEKIIYYKDKIFKARLLPPAKIQPLAILPITPSAVSVPAKNLQPDNTSKEITPADIDKLDKLNLSDFDCNFDDIEIPKGKLLSEAEIEKAVNVFLLTMTDDRR